MSKLNCDDALKLKLGDVLYEYDYGQCIESRVSQAPVEVPNGAYGTGVCWETKYLDHNGNEQTIDYFISREYEHYGPNVYTYKAYQTGEEIKEELSKLRKED